MAPTGGFARARSASWLARHWASQNDQGQWQILGHAAHKIVNAQLLRVDELLEIYKCIRMPVLAVEASDDTEPADHITARGIPAADHGCGLQSGIRVFVTDVHGNVALFGRGPQELEEDDVLLQGLQDRAQGHREVRTDPREIRRPREHHPLLALLDKGISQGQRNRLRERA